MDKEQEEDVLKQFSNLFPEQLKKGMLLDFTWRKEGELVGK